MQKIIETIHLGCLIMALILIAICPPETNAECDMAAMLTGAGYDVSGMQNLPGVFNDPNDFFKFLMHRSSAIANRDGYGLICAGDDGLFPNPVTNTEQVEFYFARMWYVKALDITANQYYYLNYPGPMDAARNWITNASNNVAIVLGHDRNANGALGCHPFRFAYNERVYTFMHNGSLETSIKSALYHELGGAIWFENHASNWTVDARDDQYLIDSEILFHWIMSKIMAHDGDVIKGVHEALTTKVNDLDLQQKFATANLSNIINFVLSDGEALYLFRNASDNRHLLAWGEPQTGLFMVKTQAAEGLTHPLNPCDFVYLSRSGEPITIADFIRNPAVNDTTSDPVGVEIPDSEFHPSAIDYLEPGLGLMEAAGPNVRLQQNNPNPFFPTITGATTINYELPETGHVRLAIYNMAGQFVRLLVDDRQYPGAHCIEWDGRNDDGKTATAGLYYYHLETPSGNQTRRMLLLK